MTEERSRSLHPISLVLCDAYNALYERGEVSFPLFEPQVRNIDSIVKTVNATYFGFVRYPTPEEQAAAYFCYIIKGHPVTDGNKRLAVLWVQFFCDSLGLDLQLPEGILDGIAVAVEQSSEKIEELIPVVRQILFN